jgi:hypothetical protein
MNFIGPTLKDLFNKEEVVVVKREYRRMYRINWAIFFSNLYKFIAFWKPKNKRYLYNTIVSSQTEDEVALLKNSNIEAAVVGKNNMEE